MSATTRHLATPAAPWRSSFLAHISKMDSPEFVLCTLHPTPPSSHGAAAPHAPTPYLPRARFCICRGLWASLPENRHNAARRNERAFESDLPTFTTDARMEKVAELFATGPGRGDATQAQGSGGGGPVEAVFWAKEVGVQWRVRGSAWVVAPDIESRSQQHGEVGEGAGDESSGVRSAKAAIGSRMRVVHGAAPEQQKAWSWATELTAHFGNCSPGMRGTWRNPPPGTKVEAEPDEEHRLGQKVEDLEDRVARANFRVVVIVPDVVESVDLSDPAKARRHLYTFVEKEGEGRWEEEVLWP